MNHAERNAAVESLQALVWRIVNRPENRAFDRDDLYSVGILTAIKAVDSYREGETELSTWVWMRVSGAIENERRRLRVRSRWLRCDRGAADDIDALSDEFPDTGPDAHSLVESEDLNRTLRAAVDTLPESERRVVTLRYGLDGGGQRMLSEVAELMGCTVGVVRHLERRAIQRLRHPLLHADLWAVVQDEF